MGLTWLIGYLSVISATSFIVQMLFCVFNSMQGYVIFMLYVIRRPEVRKGLTTSFRSRSNKNAWSHSPQSSPRMRPRDQRNNPAAATEPRQFTQSESHGDRSRHIPSQFEPTIPTMPSSVPPFSEGTNNSRGQQRGGGSIGGSISSNRRRATFAPSSVPFSTVEDHRINGSVDDARSNLDDVLNISDDEDFNRTDEAPGGIDDPVEPDTTFDNGYF